MKLFIAGRTIHGLAALMFAWIYYNMLARSPWHDFSRKPEATDMLLVWLLVAVIAMTAVGQIIGGSAEASCIREEAPDLVFFGSGGAGFMAGVIALAEKDGGVPVGIGMAVTSVAIIVIYVAVTILAIRRYREHVKMLALASQY